MTRLLPYILEDIDDLDELPDALADLDKHECLNCGRISVTRTSANGCFDCGHGEFREIHAGEDDG